jgi:hypothetical protein
LTLSEGILILINEMTAKQRHDYNFYQDPEHIKNPEHNTLTKYGFKYKETKRYFGSVGHQYVKPGHVLTVFSPGPTDPQHLIKKTRTTHMGIKDLNKHLSIYGG